MYNPEKLATQAEKRKHNTIWIPLYESKHK